MFQRFRRGNPNTSYPLYQTKCGHDHGKTCRLYQKDGLIITRRTGPTQERGAYPAIPVQEYRNGPFEEIAVHCVRINRNIENKAAPNQQQEENVRSAELDFMIDLETLLKETAADPNLIEVQCCLEDNKPQQRAEDYKKVAKRPTFRSGITMVDDRIFLPKSLRYEALNALHFGTPE